jgi:hypothetical protein
VSQRTVCRFERGSGNPSIALVERMFGALDVQLRVETEPLGTDLDAEIDRYADLSASELVDEVEYFEDIFRHLQTLPFVVSGRLAALVQGAPVSVRWVDLVVLERDLPGYAKVFERAVCKRWNDFDFGPVDPREPGPMRWLLGFHEVRLDVHQELPRTTTLVVGERTLRVQPLPDVEAADVARVMRRVRAEERLDELGRSSPVRDQRVDTCRHA